MPSIYKIPSLTLHFSYILLDETHEESLFLEVYFTSHWYPEEIWGQSWGKLKLTPKGEGYFR